MNGSLDLILVTLLLSVLLSFGSSRMMALIKLIALQGALVSLTPIFLEPTVRLSNGGILFFQLMLLIKAVLIPGLLYLALNRISIKREVEPLIGYHASLIAGIVLVLVAVFISRRLSATLQGEYTLLLITAITTLGGGLFLMMSRTKALTQVIGYMMLENGIYLVGTALTKHARSIYLVEFGVLLDLLVGVMIMGIILHNINRAFDDVDTSYLGQLKD
ncbi:MAG: hydrogenase [Desulfobulbus sp.]